MHGNDETPGLGKLRAFSVLGFSHAGIEFFYTSAALWTKGSATAVLGKGHRRCYRNHDSECE
jgi:hypothetical protein